MDDRRVNADATAIMQRERQLRRVGYEEEAHEEKYRIYCRLLPTMQMSAVNRVDKDNQQLSLIPPLRTHQGAPAGSL